MNIFELFGTITVDNKAANEVLDETMKKAQTLNDELGRSGAAVVGTGNGRKTGNNGSDKTETNTGSKG